MERVGGHLHSRYTILDEPGCERLVFDPLTGWNLIFRVEELSLTGSHPAEICDGAQRISSAGRTAGRIGIKHRLYSPRGIERKLPNGNRFTQQAEYRDLAV